VYWKLLLIALPVFFAIDILWLGLVARGFYRRRLGSLLAEKANWAAAVVFYLIFIAGLVLFVIEPAVGDGSWPRALGYGAAFGFVTYATYDLTNLATLKAWPLSVTIVDLVWGTVLAASVATATYGLAEAFGV
jgi:uncharacterized membrane protein